jgi:predicted nucleotidyltransferase
MSNEMLLNQIKIIQRMLKGYLIKDCILYGSRVKGYSNDYSDFDIAVDVEPIRQKMKNVDWDLPMERKVQLILDEAGRKLCYKLNADINIAPISMEEIENDSIYQPRVFLIKEGKKVKDGLLIDKIEEIQSDYKRKVKIYRNNDEQIYFLNAHKISYSLCARFDDYLDEYDVFLNPSYKFEISMRNIVINSLAKLSRVVEKVGFSIVERSSLPLDNLVKINKIVKSKQKEKNNFNTLDLGWHVCCEEDLEIGELYLFCETYFELQGIIEDFMNNDTIIGGSQECFMWSKKLYSNSVKDTEGFLNVIMGDYVMHTKRKVASTYKKLLTQ